MGGGRELVTYSILAPGVFALSHPRCLLCPTVENTQLTLNLQTENKGGVVSGGELTIFLDGPTVDLGSVPNGSAVTDGECCPAPPGRGGLGGKGDAQSLVLSQVPWSGYGPASPGP